MSYRIKKLEWERRDAGTYVCVSPMGWFTISKEGPREWHWEYYYEDTQCSPSLAAAKRDIQALHESNIRECIETETTEGKE